MKRPRRSTASSNTYRFFVEPAAVQGETALLEDAALVHQLTSVLRLQPGEQVTLLDNQGWQYLVELTALERRAVRGRILHKAPAPAEPQLRLTLFQALLRPERFELVLQKATELGVHAIVPLVCAHSYSDDQAQRKAERWQRIVREAAEQSRRGAIPVLAEVQPFAQAVAEATRNGLALLLWEGQAAPLRQLLETRLAAGPLETLALLSGPEGGWSAEEVAEAQAQGCLAASLGPRILRAETAPIAASAAALYALGELG